MTVNELATAVRAAAGAGLPPRLAPARPGDIRHSLADFSSARTVLGYRPSTDLRTGLERSLVYYRKLPA